MEPIHPRHAEKNQCRVKHVVVELLGHQLPVVALEVLDRTEDASDEDQGGRDVEGDEVALPAYRGLVG